MNKTEILYTVVQNGYELTDAMEKHLAEQWILMHKHEFSNLQLKEVKYR